MKRISLAEIVKINPGFPAAADRNLARRVSFVPMASVSELGGVVATTDRALGEVLKGYTPFSIGDVLLAKITPCFENGKAALVERLPHDIGFGSTEFHVLRPSPAVDGRYLFYAVWNSAFRRLGEQNMTGTAGQKRVPTAFLQRYKIPLPPLEEQRRIAAILDKGDGIRRKRREAVQLAGRLAGSAFISLFGDPSCNPFHWDIRRLGDLITDGPQNGLYRPAADYGTGAPIVRIDSFYDGAIQIKGLKRVRLDENAVGLYGLRRDDILINRVNSREYLGKSALVPELTEPTVFESNMMRIHLDESLVDPEYAIALLQTDFFKRQVRRRTKDAVNQASINQQDVVSFLVVLPPMALQQRYRVVRGEIAGLNGKLERAAAEADRLFDALSHHAFSRSAGE